MFHALITAVLLAQQPSAEDLVGKVRAQIAELKAMPTSRYAEVEFAKTIGIRDLEEQLAQWLARRDARLRNQQQPNSSVARAAPKAAASETPSEGMSWTFEVPPPKAEPAPKTDDGYAEAYEKAMRTGKPLLVWVGGNFCER